MAGFEYLIDEAAVAWSEPARPDRKDRGFSQKLIADGLDGRPYAVLARMPEGFQNPPHMHTEAQFQVLLEGLLDFYKRPLTPISVHYTDANVPYGPFTVGPGMTMAVVRCRAAEQIYSTDPRARKLRNAQGRESYAFSQGIPWTEQPKLPGARRKVLVAGKSQRDVSAEVYEHPPGITIPRGIAPFGRFHIILSGSASFGGREVKPYSMVFERGYRWATALVTGPAGATLVSVTFDQAAQDR